MARVDLEPVARRDQRSRFVSFILLRRFRNRSFDTVSARTEGRIFDRRQCDGFVENDQRVGTGVDAV